MRLPHGIAFGLHCQGGEPDLLPGIHPAAAWDGAAHVQWPVRATAWPPGRAEVDQGAEAIPNEGVLGAVGALAELHCNGLAFERLVELWPPPPPSPPAPRPTPRIRPHDFFHPVSPKMIRRTSPQAGRLHLIDEGSVSVGFKIRTADGTLINHIEGCKTGTKEAVSQSFERDRAGSFCVLTRSPGDRQGRVFREFARRLAWNGSERNSSSGSQQIALAGGWLCSLESYRRSGALSVDAGAAEKLSPLVSGSPTIRSRANWRAPGHRYHLQLA